MFTLPIIDVKTDALDALLASLGFRLQQLAKNRSNDVFNGLIENKDVTLQFTSPSMARFYRFEQGRFHQGLGVAESAGLTVHFNDSMAGARLLTKGDVAALMSAIQAGEVSVTGDYKLVLWFAGIAKHATKIPEEYQAYINQAKPYIAQAKPYAEQVLGVIKRKLGK
ncbi:hypothetical protein B0181_01340 [Moraxella caviae]|uniref:SCP2 domain-containing protein n=1 Tax=Moraxella caviae TaxID=34060 RepID=A0A1T0AAN9_9GAMM|nr:hypothetical protein [Moraxella caviae]OOR92806.1 hypothetical protein B0181_01340 [Moraxella caviae]STZ14156.1 Uncharacterised protein [Moraxella caviae]VEW12602.1 Uncharacterised protein [Moraxella caviae]